MTVETVEKLILLSALFSFSLGFLLVNLAQKYPEQTLRVVNKLRRAMGAAEIRKPHAGE